VNWAEIGIVWRKELLDILRDRRTIMAMIVVPLLVYPILIIVISQLGIAQVEKLKASKARVTVQPAGAAPSLIQALSADSTFTLMDSESPEADLRDRKLDAILEVPDDFESRVARVDSVDVTVLIDLSRDRGESMRDRIEDFLRAWRGELVADRLYAENLSPVFVTPFTFHIDNTAGERKMGGSLIGRILPFLLVVMMISGAFYPAIDVTAGERERGTLETLLVVPARRLDIVIGKFLTVFVACIVTTLANLLSIAFTFYFLVGGANLGGEFTNFADLLNARALVLIFVIMIPLAIFMSSLSMLVASFARSFKEAQNYLSPLMIVCMAPAYLSFLPGVEVDTLWSLVPIANIVLLSRELLLGNYAWAYFALTMGTMTSLALWLLSRAVLFFGNESMLGGAEAGPRFSLRNLFRRDPNRPPGKLSPALLVQVFLLVLIGFFYIGTPLQLNNLKLGLVLTQVLIIAGIPILGLRIMHIPIASTLGLRRPDRSSVLFFTLLLAPAATLVAAAVAMGQGLFLEVPDSYREMMEKLFQLKGGGGGLAVAVLVFAVTPAVCEEILFRGFMLHGLARRMKPAPAILWTAVLFGAFHFDLYRLLPTAALGAILGTLVWLTGSLWPAILLHATNNSIAVLTNDPRVVERVPWLAEGADIPWPVVGLVAAVGVIAMSALIHRRDRRGFGAPAPEVEPAPPPPQPWADVERTGS